MQCASASSYPSQPAISRLLSYRAASPHRESAQRIRQWALYTAPTGSPNRCYFIERLRVDQAVCTRTGQHDAMLFIDLDNFRNSTDHEAATTVAQRLERIVRTTYTVSRLGGDELVILRECLAQAHRRKPAPGWPRGRRRWRRCANPRI